MSTAESFAARLKQTNLETKFPEKLPSKSPASLGLKSIADTSVTECDDVIIAMDDLSTKKTNTAATNLTSNTSINCHSKNVRECYILHTFLLAILLLLIIIIICNH